MASKMSDYEAVIEFLKKENKEYSDLNAVLTQECERYKKECEDAKALYKVMESEFDKEKAKFDTEKANFLAEKKAIASQHEALQSNVTNQFYRLQERDEQEQIRIQIENYHIGLEPQEDGTYKSELVPTAERNAELAYMDMREEQRMRAEE